LIFGLQQSLFLSLSMVFRVFLQITLGTRGRNVFSDFRHHDVFHFVDFSGDACCKLPGSLGRVPQVSPLNQTSLNPTSAKKMTTWIRVKTRPQTKYRIFPVSFQYQLPFPAFFDPAAESWSQNGFPEFKNRKPNGNEDS
jgi:hypothetical protein